MKHMRAFLERGSATHPRHGPVLTAKAPATLDELTVRLHFIGMGKRRSRLAQTNLGQSGFSESGWMWLNSHRSERWKASCCRGLQCHCRNPRGRRSPTQPNCPTVY